MPESLLKELADKPMLSFTKRKYRKPAGESLRDVGYWLSEQWRRRWVKRSTISALVVLLCAGSAFAYVQLRPRAVPDVFEDDLADVLDYSLLSENFNKLPLDERLRLLKDLVAKIKGMDSNDSALMAGFMAGITGKARAQLQRNAEKLGVDIWDKFALDYSKVQPENRDEYLDKAFVDFTKMMEDLAGIKNPMEDNKRLEEAKKQTQANKPPPVPNDIDAGRLGQFMGFINDRSQKLTTPQQMGRMSEFGRDMSKRLAGGSLSKPKAAPPTPAPSPAAPK